MLLIDNLAARPARPVVVIAATKAASLLASNTPSPLALAVVSSRLERSEIVVAGLACRQRAAHGRAVVGADTVGVAGGAAGPLALGLNAGQGGQGVDEVERLDHRDES